jgi:hypothetical protein
MGTRIRSRCGKRPKPFRELGIAFRESITPDGSATVKIYKDGKRIGQGPAGETAPGPARQCITDASGGSLEHGQACAPQSALTVFLCRGDGARRNFLRFWGGKCDKNGKPLVRFHRLSKGTQPAVIGGESVRIPAPLVDARGEAYSVLGDSATIAEMVRDHRVLSHLQTSQPRCALSSGQFARKPRSPKDSVRRQVTYRTVGAAALFVRI